MSRMMLRAPCWSGALLSASLPPAAVKETVSGLSVTRRMRFAFSTRQTELSAIARPAIIGLSSQPVKGYSTPAAMGMPMML